jgi:hypothetical protein
MRPKELKNFLEVLDHLRTVVDELKAQDQWLPGSADRPVSRVKVREDRGGKRSMAWGGCFVLKI